MAEGGRQPLDKQDIDDYLYSENLYVDRLPENYSCPVCLCPVQRTAHLTQCCGNHFCRVCIDRVRRERKPCPMCKGCPVVIFPNKERQREINQLKVLCPLRDEDEVDGGCNWTGELGQMYSHIVEKHRNDKNAEENTLAVDFEHCQIEDSRLPRHEINRSTASSSLEILSDDTQGGTNLASNQVLVLSSSHWVTPIHTAVFGGVSVSVSSSSCGPLRQVAAVQSHQTPHVVPLESMSSGHPSGQSAATLRQRHQSPRIVPIQTHSHCHHHPHLHPHPHPHPHHHPHCHGPRHPHSHGLRHPHPHPHGPRHPHPHPHGPRPGTHGHPHPHHHGPRCPMHPHHHGPRHSHPHHHCPRHP